MTFSEDPEVKAGWGWINLNWLFKSWAWPSIEWHDRVTSKDSTAQQQCISGDRIAEAWDDQLKEQARQKPGVLSFLVSRIAGPTMRWIQRPFYEGPQNEVEAQACRKAAEFGAPTES